MSAPSGNDHDAITHAARLLQARYGEDGAVIAVMRAAEAAAMGDLEMADHWEAVAAMIDAPDATAPDALN
ncbi:hypothetical protein [Aquidulcibacter sp.]|uniref:hypothetical protein n=1 Tax=Aquidulcibacter sp. TaxID=2052990 RepID=UPI00078DA668|nr:hypothetical protein [Aquidulcibacter sp.]AMS29797.1 hypothetical protein AEM38_10640 [Hyphomonadaceae bacterium UKL13-1]MCE2890097.1 hypothetical protein [Hyphomonadaceae bacterium]OYU52609.1 MAG: hypothetical protein CFE27_04405 [Alphaproteobacteria bacterium PA1]MCA3695410.1 hypothetical protein [Aquidulcibacter sp.]MCZ8208908.1 hypothetical protein [Aquidulcibacter sp.]